MFGKKWGMALVLVVSQMSAAVRADTDMETVLVTGSHLPQAELTAAVSVLDAPTIRALNKRSVADLLQTVPGLLVEQQGGPGGLTAVSIRGGEANFTLVLLDGVPVNDPTNTRGGSYDFANLDPAVVQRIEIVRGPQSAVYGSDALAGVINIITRRNEGGHHQQATAEMGEKGYNNQSLTAFGNTQTLHYGVNLTLRDDGELTPGSTRQTRGADINLDWQALEAQLISIAYRYLDGERGSYPEQSGGPEFAVSDKLDRGDYTDETLALSWQADFAAHWRSRLSATRFEHEEDYTSPGIFPFSAVPPNGADTEFRRDEIRWVNSFEVNENYQLTLGADYRDEQGRSEGYLDFGGFLLPTDFELDRDSTGLLAGISGRPLAPLLLQASLRHDDPSGFSSETTARVGATIDVSSSLAFSANWGEGYKLPSFFALGHALLGNPDLLPETSTGWDLGLAWSAAPALRMQATYFYNDFEDLVDFDPENFTNVNRSAVESSGAELQLSWAVSEVFDLQTQATYTDLDVKDNASVLLGRPQWKAGAFARWQLARQWNALLDYQWTGKQMASSRYTGQTVVQELDDYHRVDLSLQWRAREQLQFELAVDNLLDEDYQNAVGFHSAGRVVRFGLKLQNLGG